MSDSISSTNGGGLAGGSPFTSPAKPGFFDSLMKKDASQTPAGGTPAGTPTAALAAQAQGLNNGKTEQTAVVAPKGKQNSAPSMEDLQLLMDQLSSMSQSLADSQMQNLELKEKNAVTQQLYDQMKIERDFMITKSEAQEKEMLKLREKISFSALDEMNEQLKTLKNELAESNKENEALKSQNQILYQNYADINAEFQSVHEEAEGKSSELKRLLLEKTEVESERDEMRMLRDRLAQDLQTQREQLAELKEVAENTRIELETSRLAEAKEAREELQRKYDQSIEELHEMTTDRNRCKKLAESIQIDMKKLHSALQGKSQEQDKLLQENQRLREDLARKSKSLQDALTALAVAMETQSFKPAPSLSTTETILVGGSSSGSSIGGRDLMGLQGLCNRLSETIKEKDDLIGVLRKQCVGLGKRVIELEAGTLPDFSEKGIAAAAAAEAEARASSNPGSVNPSPSHASSASSSTSTAPATSPSPLSPGSELLRATVSDGSNSRRLSASPEVVVGPGSDRLGSHRPDYSAKTSQPVTPKESVDNPETSYPRLSSYSNRQSFSAPADGIKNDARVSSAAATAAQAYLASVEHDLP